MIIFKSTIFKKIICSKEKIKGNKFYNSIEINKEKLLEGLIYLSYLSDERWLVTNTKPFINITDYPDTDELNNAITRIKNHIALDSDKIEHQIKSPRSTNIIVLVAASPFIDIPYKSLEAGIKNIFIKKGEKVMQLNLDALKAGREFTEEYTLVGSK